MQSSPGPRRWAGSSVWICNIVFYSSEELQLEEEEEEVKGPAGGSSSWKGRLLSAICTL